MPYGETQKACMKSGCPHKKARSLKLVLLIAEQGGTFKAYLIFKPMAQLSVGFGNKQKKTELAVTEKTKIYSPATLKPHSTSSSGLPNKNRVGVARGDEYILEVEEHMPDLLNIFSHLCVFYFLHDACMFLDDQIQYQQDQ